MYLEDIRNHRTPARRSSESGAGKLKGFLVLVVILLVIISAVKIVPPYFADYQLSDKMQEQARFAVVNHYGEDQIRDNILKVVQDLEIPVKREAIKVTSNNSLVTISVEYTVPVDILFYHLDLHFAPSSANKALF